MKRKVLAVILALIMVFAFCGCGFREKQGTAQTDTLYYGYNNLSFLQQSIYNEILEGAQKMETEFDLFDVTEEDIAEAYHALVYDHPELFWLSDGYEYTLNTYSLLKIVDLNFMDFDVVSLEINEELNVKIAEFDQKISEIIAEANTYSTDYEKILFIYDYIVKNTVYDQATADKLDTEEALNTVYPAQTAYGCLVEGKAICSGYSEAFQLLLQKLGIVCGNAFGTSKDDGVEHQWNFAMLDGEFYYFDVTWADPIDEDGTEADYKTYEYFGITTDQLELTHTLEEEAIVPECTATKYNYYSYNGMYAENYSYASTSEILKSQLANRQMSIRYSSAEQCDIAQRELFDNYKIFNISSSIREVYYLEGGSGCLLIILK